MSLLQCVGLVKDYPGKRAVDGVSFNVERGEVVGLLGPNGAGKTTTFRMACGLSAPTEGRVLLNEVDVTNWPMYRRARQGMGYLPQDESIFVKLSVEQNLLAILEYLVASRKERHSIADRLLREFGLADKRQQIASTLSGGERRRLEIARCLASKPTLILLDEPFTGIDPVTIHEIQDIIADLRDSGIAILLTDHRERETLAITDRNYVICNGKVLCSGNAETVLSDPAAQRLYFGSRFDAPTPVELRDSSERIDADMASSESAMDVESAPPEVPASRNFPHGLAGPHTSAPSTRSPERVDNPSALGNKHRPPSRGPHPA